MWSSTLCDRTGHVVSVCWDLAEPGGQSNVSDSSVTVTRSERREPGSVNLGLSEIEQLYKNW